MSSIEPVAIKPRSCCYAPAATTFTTKTAPAAADATPTTTELLLKLSLLVACSLISHTGQGQLGGGYQIRQELEKCSWKGGKCCCQ